MNENLNLVEILKDCPKGTKLYSTTHGEVELVRVCKNVEDVFPIEVKRSDGKPTSFMKNGRFYFGYDGECTLFPSKDQRDWSKFKIKKHKFDPKTLEHFDKVLVRDNISFLDTLESVDPYEQCVQYDSIKAGIQAHAETYSFNIESELFNQLTKEQQALWRKEIEQACISGGEAGVELARDPRYKENL